MNSLFPRTPLECVGRVGSGSSLIPPGYESPFPGAAGLPLYHALLRSPRAGVLAAGFLDSS